MMTAKAHSKALFVEGMFAGRVWDKRPIPADRVTHHFSAGQYAKEVQIRAGEMMVQHKHAYDHMSILASGEVEVDCSGDVIVLRGPAVTEIKAGVVHSVRARTDAVWFCIHPTNETDPDRIDAAAIAKDTG